jgi:hypothetical protein
VIYETKTAVFAMQNYLSKGLGLQCIQPIRNKQKVRTDSNWFKELGEDIGEQNVEIRRRLAKPLVVFKEKRIYV